MCRAEAGIVSWKRGKATDSTKPEYITKIKCKRTFQIWSSHCFILFKKVILFKAAKMLTTVGAK